MRCWMIAAVALCVLGGKLSEAPAQEGLAERIGEKIDRGLDELSSDLKQGWAKFRSSVERVGVQGRVYARLRWDKHIDTDTVDVEMRKDDVVVLKGSVSSAAAKKKAVQLARDTVGVSSVVDELTVELPQDETKVD